MKKSICIEKIYLELPWEKRFEAVKKAGFEYVEFWSWVNKDIPLVKKLLKDNELKLASMSGDNDYSMIVPAHKEKFLEYLKRSIEISKELGCEHLVMHSNAIDENGQMADTAQEYSDTTKIAAATLAMAEAAKLAEDAEILLVIEAINLFTKPGYYMYTTQQTGDLARAIDSKNVKILYDTWHMQQMEGNMIQTLRSYQDVLGYIHIGDAPERYEPGTGEINFDRLKEELHSIGYDGIFGFELVPKTTSDACARILGAF
ncbi:MAG: TIM barrel protein [Christensenellales bacterium]